MSKKNEMPTQSEQYDEKLRSELYTQVLEMDNILSSLRDAEEKQDEELGASYVIELMANAPRVVDAYMKCIEGGKDV